MRPYTDTKLAYLTWTWQRSYVSGHILMWKWPYPDMNLYSSILYLALSFYASALKLGYWPYHYWDKARRLNALPYLNVKVALSSHLSSLVIIVPNLILTWTSSQRWVSGHILFCKQSHRDRIEFHSLQYGILLPNRHKQKGNVQV